MYQSANYRRAFAKVVFLVLLLAAMAAPKLLSAEPALGFAQFRSMVRRTAAPVWIGIWVGAALALLIAMGVRRAQIAAKSTEGGKAAQIQGLPIQEAVSQTHNGNGLVSDAFPLILPWREIAGWVKVEEKVECLTINGTRVKRRTHFRIDPMRLIGKPSSARRVLLAPAPQVIPTVEALSKDKWTTRIDATITLRVRDPIKMLAARPFEDLSHLAQGVIGEHIRSNDYEELLSDTGDMRHALEARLRDSPTLQGLEIIEVPIKVTADERMLETRRLEEIQRQMRTLVQLQGENKLTEAEYQIQIREMEARLGQWMKQQEHERDMERRTAELEAEMLQGLVAAIAEIAASGLDPAGAIREIRKLMPRTDSEQQHEPEAELLTDTILARETRALEENQQELGVTALSLEPNPNQPTNPGRVRMVFHGFVLVVDCPDDYPESAPLVRVEPDNDEPFDLGVPWQPGGRLVDVATAAAMQVPFELQQRAQQGG